MLVQAYLEPVLLRTDLPVACFSTAIHQQTVAYLIYSRVFLSYQNLLDNQTHLTRSITLCDLRHAYTRPHVQAASE